MKKIVKLLEIFCGHAIMLLAWLWGYLVFRVINRIQFVGQENIPSGEKILFVSNHQTLIDSWLIGPAVVRFWEIIFYPSRVPWNAPAQENFYASAWHRFLFRLLKTIPTVRGQQSRRQLIEQFRRWEDVLSTGRVLLFFEGTRTRTGEINACKGGVADLIYRCRPVVVPIYLENINAIMPLTDDSRISLKKFFALKSGMRGRLIIGAPIQFGGLLDEEKNSLLRKKIGETVRQAVVALKNSA